LRHAGRHRSGQWCLTSGLTTLLDVLRTAEGLRRSLNVEIPSIDVEIGGCSDTVLTRNGRPSDSGYSLVARDGGIFAFGDAIFFGSTGRIRRSRWWEWRRR
jgi:hypothetical protein